MSNGTIFIDLDRPLNASRGLSASPEFLFFTNRQHKITKKDNSKQKKQNKNLTKPTEEKQEKNLY